MSDDQAEPPRPSGPPARPPVDIGVSGQRDVSVGDVAAGDISKSTTAGRDVVAGDVVSTTTVGFSAAQVQKLLVTVGALVFVTAACFFSGGLVVGGAAFTALQRPVNSDSAAAAAQFQSKLDQLAALPAGQPFILNLTEEEFSAYFRLALGPQMGVTDGKLRLLDEPGQFVMSGKAVEYGNLPFIATFELQEDTGSPFRLTSAAVQVLGLAEGTQFGWMAVPAGLFQPKADSLNSLFAGVALTGVAELPRPEPAWSVGGVAR